MSIQTKEQKMKLSNVVVGDKLSMTYYLRVLGTQKDSLIVEDQNGISFTIKGKELIEETIYSANQFTEVKNVSRTEAIDILESAGDTVFRCIFNKLPNEESFSKLMENLTIADLNNPKQLKKIAKQAMLGEERTLIGYLVSAEPKMGRSTVVDLNIPKGSHNLRQIDHRTLQSIVLKGIKYIVK
jgi:hypothetical protein